MRQQSMRKHPHRLAALLLCLALWAGLLVPAAGAAAVSTPDPADLAADLQQLGLLQGVSEGAADFDLDRAPTRAEALTMLIRVLGKESEALNGTWSHPFTDVPAWAAPYVGYAYEHQLTTGVSDTRFGSTQTVDLASYLTFLLRALGYSDQTNAEFSWKFPHALATQAGILPLEVDWSDFRRADLVRVSYAALSAALKDSDTTLAQRLIADGVFTQAQFEAVYRPDAFADSAAVHSAVSQVILAREGGLAADNVFRGESHVVLEAARRGGTLTVTVRYFCGRYTYRGSGSSTTGSSGIAVVTLAGSSGGPYTLTAYRSGPVDDMPLSAQAQQRSDLLAKAPGALQAVCTAQADAWHRASQALPSDEVSVESPAPPSSDASDTAEGVSTVSL